MFLYQTIPSTTSFSTSVSLPQEMLQGQGSLQAPRGAALPRQREMQFHVEQGGICWLSHLCFRGLECLHRGGLEGEWAPGAAGTPGMGQDTGNATGWQWALNLLCQPVRETCRERKFLVCSSRNSSSSFIFLHLPGATSPMLKDTELL